LHRHWQTGRIISIRKNYTFIIRKGIVAFILRAILANPDNAEPFCKDDLAKEPIAASYSVPGVLAEAVHRTGRAKADFELREISREEYERLKSLLHSRILPSGFFLSRHAKKALLDRFASDQRS
jgi:hypothetical protein